MSVCEVLEVVEAAMLVVYLPRIIYKIRTLLYILENIDGKKKVTAPTAAASQCHPPHAERERPLCRHDGEERYGSDCTHVAKHTPLLSRKKMTDEQKKIPSYVGLSMQRAARGFAPSFFFFLISLLLQYDKECVARRCSQREEKNEGNKRYSPL